MFSTRVLVLVAVVASVAAVPAVNERRQYGNTCNTGGMYYCNQVQEARTIDFQSLYGDDASGLASLFNSSTVPMGLGCSPLAGGASGQCNQQTVCCDGTTMNNGELGMNCNAYNGGLTGAVDEAAAAAT